jgi:hypothetical protein
MGNSTLPTVLDKLCMVANINTRKLIELKKAEIKIKEAKIQALSELIDSLEQKINDQACRLDALTSTLSEFFKRTSSLPSWTELNVRGNE